jgi:hypothetical protein
MNLMRETTLDNGLKAGARGAHRAARLGLRW